MKKPKTVLELRQSRGMNQTEFWKTLGTTQSGGSRYENGRDMPNPVLMLLEIKYGWKPK
jgi:transcriptional regulator with XRE-family HTH domain